MKLIAQKDVVRQEILNARYWIKAYGKDQRVSSKAKTRGGRVAALDPETATLADVSAVDPDFDGLMRCHECSQNVPAAVSVGEPPDYESSTATLCGACLRKALELVEPRLVPLVIRDRRPTREEVERATIDGDSRWVQFRSGWLEMWRRDERYGDDEECALSHPDPDVDWKETVCDGSPAPGEVWRALNSDGSPLLVEVAS